MNADLDKLGTVDALEAEAEAVQADAAIVNAHAAMLKEIRSWGIWLLLFGVLHIFAAGFLSAPWGVLLLIVGLASFYFRASSMFVIYAVTLTWAAISNISSLEIVWVFFALFQIYLAFRIFQQFRRFRNVEAEYIEVYSDDKDSVSAKRAARFFPWLGSCLGCSSILGLALIIFIVFILAVATEGEASLPDYFGFIEGLIVNFGVLGFAICLSALISRYRPKALAIAGLVAGILTLLIELALIFL